MDIFIILMSCLMVISAQVTPKPTVISGIQFGQMEKFAKTEDMVYHLEEDISRPGFIMFSDGSSLKTTDGKTTYTIVGNAVSTDYLEGSGGAARFRSITGFTQLNETQVVIVDYGNHCLRLVDRTKNLSSRFVGNCTFPGNLNGLDAYFYNPWSVIKDNKTKNHNYHDSLLVTDSKNQAVRFVDTEFKSVFTYLDSRNGLNLPYGIAYDPRVGNLFTTNFNYVMAHNAEDDRDILVTGNFSEGFNDGDLQAAKFNVPAELISLRNHLLLLADQNNNVLRLLDLKASTISSVCNKKNKTLNGSAMTCQLNNPRSLLLATDDYLYVGQFQAIRRIAVTLPLDEVPPVIPGASLSGCSNTNSTFQLKGGEKRVEVKLLPGYVFSLSAGEHKIYIEEEDCTITVIVQPEIPDKTQDCPSNAITKTIAEGNDTFEVEINTGEFLTYPEGSYVYRTENCTINITILPPPNSANTNSSYQCADKDVTLVVPDGEDTATYTEVLDGISHNIELPVGEHRTTIHDGMNNCSKNITVVDFRLKRRLIFTAQYNIKCGDIADNTSSRNVAENTANAKFVQIEELCPRACQNHADANITCSNDTTTINWPTDIIYSGNETTVPQHDLEKFRDKLSNSKNILDVTIIDGTPPIVFPNPVGNQTVNLFLEAFCVGQRTYNLATDKCD